MRRSILLLAVATTVSAQKGPCTEQAIRSAIESPQPIPHIDDIYVYSGRLNKPMIGNAVNQPVDSSMKVKKDASSRSQPERIVAAPSGDMAYEYGTVHVVHDLEDGRHTDFTADYLRVWTAVGNTCELAATQAAPENLHESLVKAHVGESH